MVHAACGGFMLLLVEWQQPSPSSFTLKAWESHVLTGSCCGVLQPWVRPAWQQSARLAGHGHRPLVPSHRAQSELAEVVHTITQTVLAGEEVLPVVSPSLPGIFQESGSGLFRSVFLEPASAVPALFSLSYTGPMVCTSDHLLPWALHTPRPSGRNRRMAASAACLMVLTLVAVSLGSGTRRLSPALHLHTLPATLPPLLVALPHRAPRVPVPLGGHPGDPVHTYTTGPSGSAGPAGDAMALGLGSGWGVPAKRGHSIGAGGHRSYAPLFPVAAAAVSIGFVVMLVARYRLGREPAGTPSPRICGVSPALDPMCGLRVPGPVLRGGGLKDFYESGRKPKHLGRPSKHPQMPLIWIDMEMTGLDVNKEVILEVACVITDGTLDTIIEGPNLVLTCDPRCSMTPCVTFRRAAVSLRGPGQSPVLPFACCVGPMLSDGRCSLCSLWCRFRASRAQ